MKSDEGNDEESWIQQANSGSQIAANQLWALHRDALKRTVRLRMHPKLVTRVDASDIVQEAFVEAARCLDSYLKKRPLPFFLWLRQLVLEKLIEAHRKHFLSQMRSVNRESRPWEYSGADSGSMANHFVDRLPSPTQASSLAELRKRVQNALDRLDPIDRELLMLRHFEQLSNQQAATILQINPSTASTRYGRALLALRVVLADLAPDE